MRFRLEIDTPPGCETTSSRLDVAWLLDSVARRLRSNNIVDQAQIIDTGDIVVGSWLLTDEELTDPYGISVVPLPTSKPKDEE